MFWLRFCNFVTKGFKGPNQLKTKQNPKICSNKLWAFILVSASQIQFSLDFSSKCLKKLSYIFLFLIDPKVKTVALYKDDMYRELYISLPT